MDKNYLIVLDTNALHLSYGKNADFTRFRCSNEFEGLFDKIEELDIYLHVKVGVSEITWRELLQQEIESYNEKIEKVRHYIFPGFKMVGDGISDYENYINNEIQKYKNKLYSRQVELVELSIPSADRFPGIVDRALGKRAPFEGKDKKSDKGFKDALIWESVLEYKDHHQNDFIILYSRDNRFDDELKSEYENRYNMRSLIIVNDQSELSEILHKIAKEIAGEDYVATDTDDINDDLFQWIKSRGFAYQFYKNISVLNIQELGNVSENKLEFFNVDNITRELSEDETKDLVSFTINCNGLDENKEVTFNYRVKAICENDIFSIEKISVIEDDTKDE
ncbi:MAG: PIN domain-containing protein [Selenomonas sp.]|nr:PIN domain-containing protein [Selenomonas sp.]